ncbi:hypothetical protein ACWCRC_31885 [Streptomyces sp. NPDC001940]
MSSAARDLTLEHFRWIDGHAEAWAVVRDAKAPTSMIAGPPEALRALPAARSPSPCGRHMIGCEGVLGILAALRRADVYGRTSTCGSAGAGASTRSSASRPVHTATWI